MVPTQEYLLTVYFFSFPFDSRRNEVIDAPARHEPSRSKIYDWIAFSKQHGNVARVYPPRMLVSLMGCKRAEGIWRTDEWVNEPCTKEKQGEKMRRTERENTRAPIK